MAKRVITKIGDIYSVKMDDKQQRFFQYVAKDSAMLNSSVIRVFENVYPIGYPFNEKEIVSDKVDFYAHTILHGNQEEYWTKVGRSADVGDVEHIMFRIYAGLDYENWYVWTINEKHVHIGILTEKYRRCTDYGCIFPFADIVEKIKTGVFPGKKLD